MVKKYEKQDIETAMTRFKGKLKDLANKVVDHVSADKNPDMERAPETPTKVAAFDTEQQKLAAAKGDKGIDR